MTDSTATEVREVAMWQTEAELDRFVADFEAGTLSKEAWTHSAHLAIGGAYAIAHNETEALNLLRAGICHLNGCHGVENSDTGGYHESLTVFWLTIIRQFLQGFRSMHVLASRHQAVEAVVKTFEGRRDLFRDYWSFNVVKSTQARREWVPPDLRSLDFRIE